MVQIEAGTFNEVVATCSRNKTLTGNVTYLWSMTHKLTKENWKFIPFRIVPSVDYAPSYDLFTMNVIDTSPEVFTASTSANTVNIHLIPGQYFVKIYEQCSTINLNPMLSYDVVYEGTATVNYSGSPQNEIVSYSGNTNIFKVYNG
jgi:hypothetical protein